MTHGEMKRGHNLPFIIFSRFQPTSLPLSILRVTKISFLLYDLKKLMRINKMITKGKCIDLLSKLNLLRVL